jgi:hypothetical protein
VLAALLAAVDDDAGGGVPEADPGLDLVDVLAAGAARAEGLDLALAQQLIVGFGKVYHRLRRRRTA